MPKVGLRGVVEVGLHKGVGPDAKRCKVKVRLTEGTVLRGSKPPSPPPLGTLHPY